MGTHITEKVQRREVVFGYAKSMIVTVYSPTPFVDLSQYTFGSLADKGPGGYERIVAGMGRCFVVVEPDDTHEDVKL